MADPIRARDLWVQEVLDYLAVHRYSESTVAKYRVAARRFLAFLEQRCVDLTDAQASHVTSFREAEHRQFRRRHGRERRAGGWSRARAPAIHLLFRLAQGSWPPPPPPPATPREQFRQEIRDGFRWWVLDVRGLSVLTFKKDWYTAGLFLDWLAERAGAASIRQLSPGDVDAFLAWRAPGLRRSTRSGVCQTLRSFLRYLHSAGFIERDLAGSVTNPPHYWNESLPTTFTDAQVQAMLAAARDDQTAAGRRDFAILLLLATYGLRAGEITRLRLDDIDWRHERICIIQSKTRRSAQLPLIVPVGEAILDYLRHDRPQSQHREVFLRVRAPYSPFSRGSCLYPVVGRYLRRAGITVAGKHGPHAFRYARAVSLLRAAVPLQAIGNLLGHRSSSSTEVYLKLCTEDLREVGLEIPEGVEP